MGNAEWGIFPIPHSEFISMRVTQLLPSVHSGDAVGDSAYEIHQAFQERGIESYILGVHIDEHLKERAIDFSKFSLSRSFPGILENKGRPHTGCI